MNWDFSIWWRSFNVIIVIKCIICILICLGKEKVIVYCIERKGRKGERAKGIFRDIEIAGNRGTEKVCGKVICIFIFCELIMGVKGFFICNG